MNLSLNDLPAKWRANAAGPHVASRRYDALNECADELEAALAQQAQPLCICSQPESAHVDGWHSFCPDVAQQAQPDNAIGDEAVYRFLNHREHYAGTCTCNSDKAYGFVAGANWQRERKTP